MSPPQLPLEVLLMIAHLLTDDEGRLCFADFNSYLKVNRALYACLNHTLWQAAVGFWRATNRVFTHLIRTNDLTRLEFFLGLGADIETSLSQFVYDDDESFDWGSETTPLKTAVQFDNVPIARLLLEHCADLVQCDEHGEPSYSVIHAARSAEMVQLLLDHHADPEQHVGEFRPLHFYAKRGNTEAMQVVLRNGVEVDPGGLSSYTPLHYAAQHSIDAVQLLLEHGADALNCASGETPLHLAARAGMTDVIRLLLERWPEGTRAMAPDRKTPLLLAAAAGKTDSVRLLLQFRPDHAVREMDHIGNTGLHLAALWGCAEVVELLVERFPEDVRGKNRWGYTPLHCVAENWDTTDVTRVFRWPDGMLEKSKAGEVIYGNTPLRSVAEDGHADVVRLLVEVWPEGLREQDVCGNTPLHLSVRGERIDVVRLLVESWPEGKDALNTLGQTPLSLFESEMELQGKQLNEMKEMVVLLGGVH
jgi:ankyrin repeat protein